MAADQLPRTARTPGKRIDRGRDAERGGVVDRLLQELDERVIDARVLDASRSEKEFHAASRSRWGRTFHASRNRRDLETGRPTRTHRLRTAKASSSGVNSGTLAQISVITDG